MGETAKRLQEIIDACERGGARTTCGGELCGECIECSARAAKVSLQREMALLRNPRGEAGGDSTDCPTCGDELAVYWEEGRIRGVVSLDEPAGVALSRTLASPADGDVREQVAMEVYVWEHVMRGAEESWARQRWQTETDGMRDLYFEAADRILALIRTPRGEGGGE